MKKIAFKFLQKKFSRLRSFFSAFVFALIFAMAFLLASCLQKPAREKTVLRMNISSEPDSLDPWKSAAADSEALWRNIFEGLMTFNAEGKIVPCLAEKVFQSEDGLSYTFTLRRGVKFHNGKEFTSSDAEFSYKNMAGLDGLKPTSAKFHAVKNVRTNGEYEFIVELKNEMPSFLIAAISPILPAGYSEQKTHPVGTGPYEFAKYEQGKMLCLKKNENYWDKKNSAKIPNVEVLFITDEAASISALQSGQLDVATMISGANVEALKNQFCVHNFPQNMVQILGMNNLKKPFDDLRVRKAIAMAVNKNEIAQGVFAGYATILHSNFSPVLKEFFAENLEGENPFDAEKAKSLLKEAGYQNGFDVTITVPANYQPHVDAAQVISENLKKIGIRCVINAVEWTAWLDIVYTKFNYEMTVIGFAGKLDAADILRRYYSTYSKNFTRFYNEDFDKNYAAAICERDQKKQAAFYKECQKVLAREVPAVFICDPQQIYLSQKNVKGILGFPILFHNFSAWSFE